MPDLPIFWLRAAHRRPGPLYFIAWAMILGPMAAGLYVAIFLPLPPIGIAVLVVAILVTFYLLRDYLPRWVWPFHPHHREPLFHADLAASAAGSAGGPASGAGSGSAPVALDPLLDPYDAVSHTGRWATGPEHAAVMDVRGRVVPPVGLAKLKRATARASRRTRSALHASEKLEVNADARIAPGGEAVHVRLVVRGSTVREERASELREKFLSAFAEALGDHAFEPA